MAGCPTLIGSEVPVAGGIQKGIQAENGPPLPQSAVEDSCGRSGPAVVVSDNKEERRSEFSGPRRPWSLLKPSFLLEENSFPV